MQMFVTTNYLLLLLLTTYLGRVELLIRADVALASLGAVPVRGVSMQCEHIRVLPRRGDSHCRATTVLLRCYGRGAAVGVQCCVLNMARARRRQTTRRSVS